VTDRLLALVDGEHYPPVVRAALRQAGEDAEVVAALLLGGSEKLDGLPDYGVPLELVGEATAGDALVAAAATHGATCVLDLSDEPVLGERDRIALACRAVAAGLGYRGPDFAFAPPRREVVDAPTLAVIGTGKRIGKTAVSGHVARVLDGRGSDVVVVAMGRGGPPEPELVDPDEQPVEDAALARVPTVGARRCGGGLLGAPYLSNVVEAARIAADRRPDIVVLEGSGAAVPPVAADRTILVHPATDPGLGDGFGAYRLLLADLVVLTMCDAPAAASFSLGKPVIRTALRPHPVEPVAGERVAFFTTARDPGPLAVHLATAYGAEVVAVSGNLSDRARLRADLETAEVGEATVYLVEIKAAAIDVVAEAAAARGVRIVFCDNRPVALPDEPDLDAAIAELAAAAVSARA
jgi:cyclic 2,3-diphosphoglycerate synthetase